MCRPRRGEPLDTVKNNYGKLILKAQFVFIMKNGEGRTGPFSDPVVVIYLSSPLNHWIALYCVILSCLISFQFSTDATYGALGVVMAVLMVGCNSACMDFWGRRNATTCLAALHFCLSLGVLTGTGMVDPLVSVL